MSVADEIGKLNELRLSGAITEQEYQKAKESLLAGKQPVCDNFKQAFSSMSADANMWGMFIHLSQFCGYVVPFAGLILPIVLWQIKKNDSEVIDQHGRVVVNWIVTEFILAIVFLLLCFVLIGIPLLVILAIVGVVFPIFGAVKASNGEVWTYPFSFRFF
jgi:uncharacterized protein